MMKTVAALAAMLTLSSSNYATEPASVVAGPAIVSAEIKPGVSSVMPLRPEPGALVRQTPPDFSWPMAAPGDRYEMTLRYPDGNLRKFMTGRNWLLWPEVLPPGKYIWNVRALEGVQPEVVNASFTVAQSAIKFVAPSTDELLRRATAAPRPRVLPKGEELNRLKAALYGIRSAAWERLLQRVRNNMQLPVATEPALLPNKSTDYVAWARQLNVTANAVKSETKMSQEATWAWLITRDTAIGREAIRRATKLAHWDPKGVSSYDSNDQMTRDIAMSLALARDSLDDLLSVAERKSLISATEARLKDILTSKRQPAGGMDRDPRDSHGYSALFVAALASTLIAGDTRAADNYFRDSVPWLLSAISPWGGENGGFSNGTAYAVWSLEYFVPTWDILKRAINVDIGNKAWTRGFSDFLLYFLPPGSPANIFGDGSEQPPARHLVKRFARRLNTNKSRWYERQTIAEDESYLWLITAVPQENSDVVVLPADIPNAILLPDVGWSAMHSNLSDRSRNSVYFKSSPHGAIVHGHAEQNSFVIHAKGKVLTSGSGYYDPYAYWGSKHWKNWYRQTRAHNAITFDGGQGQLVQRADSVGRITQFQHTPEIDYATGDATAAYGGALTKATRTVVYLRSNLVVVYDQLASETPRQWEWNIHSLEPIKQLGIEQIEIRREDISLCVSRLSGAATEFSQSNQFTEKPDTEGYPPQWHGTFSSKQRTTAAEFVFLLNIGCTPADTQVKEESGRGWRITLKDKHLLLGRNGVVTH